MCKGDVCVRYLVILIEYLLKMHLKMQGGGQGKESGFSMISPDFLCCSIFNFIFVSFSFFIFFFFSFFKFFPSLPLFFLIAFLYLQILDNLYRTFLVCRGIKKGEEGGGRSKKERVFV